MHTIKIYIKNKNMMNKYRRNYGEAKFKESGTI